MSMRRDSGISPIPTTLKTLVWVIPEDRHFFMFKEPRRLSAWYLPVMRDACRPAGIPGWISMRTGFRESSTLMTPVGLILSVAMAIANQVKMSRTALRIAPAAPKADLVPPVIPRVTAKAG
jgi:hypothetical protein